MITRRAAQNNSFGPLKLVPPPSKKHTHFTFNQHDHGRTLSVFFSTTCTLNPFRVQVVLQYGCRISIHCNTSFTEFMNTTEDSIVDVMGVTPCHYIRRKPKTTTQVSVVFCWKSGWFCASPGVDPQLTVYAAASTECTLYISTLNLRLLVHYRQDSCLELVRQLHRHAFWNFSNPFLHGYTHAQALLCLSYCPASFQ